MITHFRSQIVFIAVVLLIAYSIIGCNAPNASNAPSNNPLISKLQEGERSPELFTLPTGINEFDLLYVDNEYYLFYDDKSLTKVREAHTIKGLATAPDILVIPGRYPSAIYEDRKWHIWLWDNNQKVTKHYVSDCATGPYKFIDDGPENLADFDVVKSPVDGYYYASYKNCKTLLGGILKSESPNGPWQNLGYVFNESTRSPWHQKEEADGNIFFYLNKPYFLFAGWDGKEQRIGIVEINDKTMKALTKATCLLSPEASWQRRNHSPKVFNPVGMTDPHDPKQVYVYYAHNPSAAVVAGWGYIKSQVN